MFKRRLWGLLGVLALAPGCVSFSEDGGLTIDGGRVQEVATRGLDAVTGTQESSFVWRVPKNMRGTATVVLSTDKPPPERIDHVHRITSTPDSGAGGTGGAGDTGDKWLDRVPPAPKD